MWSITALINIDQLNKGYSMAAATLLYSVILHRTIQWSLCYNSLTEIIPLMFNIHWTVLWRHREYRRVAASMLLAVCMKYWPCLKSRSFMPPVMRRHATILYVCKSSQKRKVLPTYSNFQHSDAFWQYFLCTKVTISHRSYFPCNTIFFRYKV